MTNFCQPLSVSQCFSFPRCCLSAVSPSLAAICHYLPRASLNLRRPSLTFTPHRLLLTCQGPYICHPCNTSGPWWDNTGLNISKGTDPQHDPISCPQPLIHNFTLSNVLSQGPRWLLFSPCLVGIRDNPLTEVSIAVAVPQRTDFKSTQPAIADKGTGPVNNALYIY